MSWVVNQVKVVYPIHYCILEYGGKDKYHTKREPNVNSLL